MYIHLIGNKKMNLDELNATIHSYEQQIKYLRRHKITLKEFAKFSGIAVNLSNFRQDTLHEDFNNIKNDIINKIALNKRIS